MPKAAKNIPAFAGGEISKYNPRDIPDEALSKAQDVMMDRIGLIRLMGETDAVLVENDADTLDANITPGYGLHTFRSDKHIRLSGKIISTATYTYSGTAYTKCTCEQNHKFAPGQPGSGANIYILGAKGSLTTANQTALFKRHKIIHVIDETNFVIDLTWSSLNVDVTDAEWIWNDGWGKRPQLNNDGEYVLLVENTYDPDLTDWSYCSTADNPKASDPIDGEFIYMALQNDNAINLYHYNYDVLLTEVLTLSNENSTGLNQNGVRPSMIYINNALKVSEGKINGNGNNKIPKLFGYFPPRKFFKKITDIQDIAGGVKIGVNKKGDWNVYKGSKTDIPGTGSGAAGEAGNESNDGYCETVLAAPRDLMLNGNAATQSDYSGLQFQVSQYNTRNGTTANQYGGISSLLDGKHDVATAFGGTIPPVTINAPEMALNSGVSTNPLTGARQVYPKHERMVHMIVSGDTKTTGDWDGTEEHTNLGFGMSWVYGSKNEYQESKIYKNNQIRIKADNTPQNTGSTYNEFTSAMSYRFEFFIKHNQFDSSQWANARYNETTEDWGDPRLIGASIYITKDADGDIDDPLYLGTLYFDYREGFIDSYGNKFPWTLTWYEGNAASYIGTNGGCGDTYNNTGDYVANTAANWDTPSNVADDNDAIGCCLRRVPTLTYKLRNYGLEPYTKDYGFQARWKTSVFAQNRLFVGGVQLLDGPSGELGRVYPDRMLISPEVKYDLFPHDSYIDLQTNDGDSIVKLEHYKGKLLQFKKNVLYIIDLTGEFYFTEATHMYIGIKNPWSSAVTPGGVVWVNNNGLYIYDGSKIINLIEKKISASEWDEFCGGQDGYTSPMITFIPRHKQLLICRSPYAGTDTGQSGDVYIYDVETESFTFGKSRVPNVVKSNFSINFNDKSLLGVGSLSSSEQPLVVTTTPGAYASRAQGAFHFTGGTGTAVMQYYKGGNSEGTGGTWTTFTGTIRITSGWNATDHAAQNLADQILRSAQADWGSGTNTGWIGDLKIIGAHGWAAEEDEGLIIIEVEALETGAAYNSGAGDRDGTGHNSFRLFTDDATSNEWSTTTNNDAPEPDVGTTNGVTGWLTDEHMRYGTSGTVQVDTVTIDRRSSTASNVRYDINLKIYNAGGGGILHEYNTVYFTDSEDNSDQNLAVSIANILGGAQNLSQDTGDDSSRAALTYIDVNNPSSGSFTITSKDAQHKFQFSLTTDSAISLKQFKSDSKASRNMQIVTKEYDFEEPNVRKKIYKLYLTYKSNDTSANSASLSGVRVYYAINGSSTYHPMKTKGSSDSAGTATNLPSSTSFTQAELIPNPNLSANKPNKVYSIKFMICSKEAAASTTRSKVEDFELNDMSIIYRVKSVK